MVLIIAGNQAGTISGKLAAVLYVHRIEAGLEIPTGAPLVKRVLKAVARAHAPVV